MKTHKELLDEWIKEPEFVAEYDALADEFAPFDETLKAKKNFAEITSTTSACDSLGNCPW